MVSVSPLLQFLPFLSLPSVPGCGAVVLSKTTEKNIPGFLAYFPSPRFEHSVEVSRTESNHM
jgi:hypothetical protein